MELNYKKISIALAIVIGIIIVLVIRAIAF